MKRRNHRNSTPTSSSCIQYVLSAPISVATKLSEDTMTYLNQSQAYEVKLENITDVAEAKKGFMCSIINIGFHERHMQQAENEFWQQWSQQHPNEKIFSVDMKLSYNVFGVESDGLNKYEFLWDSSKVAGVFIRINSISTEFSPKKHGGEKGVPFKLSVETFSYNSKTHDSYFISAACCQIKVFKPKGAERKIRSDRDKISKRPLCEQEKYHRCCDRTVFKECSLTSLHPMADGSLCYYRHSHGHFASKQVLVAQAASSGETPSVQANQEETSQQEQSDEEMDNNDHSDNNSQQQDQSPEHRETSEQNRASNNSDSESNSNGQNGAQQRDYQQNHVTTRNATLLASKNLANSDYTSRPPIHHHNYGRSNNLDNSTTDHIHGQQSSTESNNFSHSNEIPQQQQTNSFGTMYHGNQARGVASLNGTNNSQHFGLSPYYNHTLPTSLAPHITPPPIGYGTTPVSGSSSNTIAHSNHIFPLMLGQQHLATKNSIYRNHDKSINNIAPSTHGNSFKASNLAITSHNNFPSYLNTNSEQCVDTTAQDMKDVSSNGNGNGYYDNYDHFHHSSIHNPQSQPIRQRSASTSMTSYMANGFLDNTMNTNHWIHDLSNHSESNNNNSNNICSRGSNMVAQSHDTHVYPNNYETNNHHFDSEQNSPHKNIHQTSESSSSCYSRFKNNSSSIMDGSGTQDIYESTSHMTVNSNCVEVASWLASNRFGQFTKTFNNFSGSDLLRLSKTELIEICGLLDGIRLYNTLHQPIKPRRVLYICHESSDTFHPIYLYDVTLKELLKEIETIFYSHIPTGSDRRTLEETKNQKGTGDKTAMSSSTDSGSSIGTPCSDAATEEGPYNRGDQFFNENELRRSGNKCHTTNASNNKVDKLFIHGLTSVKILANQQVVQMLEDESVWTLCLTVGNSGLIEANILAYRSNRASS